MNDRQSIRPFLAELERRGGLLRIDKQVDPCFEVFAFLSAADTGPALLFDRIKGSQLRIAGNLFNGRERIAASLGIGVGEILSRADHLRSTACWWRRALRAPWAASRYRSATT